MGGDQKKETGPAHRRFFIMKNNQKIGGNGHHFPCAQKKDHIIGQNNQIQGRMTKGNKKRYEAPWASCPYTDACILQHKYRRTKPK